MPDSILQIALVACVLVMFASVVAIGALRGNVFLLATGIAVAIALLGLVAIYVALSSCKPPDCI